MMETLVQNNWNREGEISPSVVSPCAPPLMSRGGARAVDAAAEAAMLLRLLRACFRRRASAVAVPSTPTACCRCSPTLFRRCRPIDAAAAALADAPSQCARRRTSSPAASSPMLSVVGSNLAAPPRCRPHQPRRRSPCSASHLRAVALPPRSSLAPVSLHRRSASRKN